jgi:hypothetical protein
MIISPGWVRRRFRNLFSQPATFCCQLKPFTSILSQIRRSVRTLSTASLKHLSCTYYTYVLLSS